MKYKQQFAFINSIPYILCQSFNQAHYEGENCGNLIFALG